MTDHKPGQTSDYMLPSAPDTMALRRHAFFNPNSYRKWFASPSLYVYLTKITLLVIVWSIIPSFFFLLHFVTLHLPHMYSLYWILMYETNTRQFRTVTWNNVTKSCLWRFVPSNKNLSWVEVWMFFSAVYFVTPKLKSSAISRLQKGSNRETESRVRLVN